MYRFCLDVKRSARNGQVVSRIPGQGAVCLGLKDNSPYAAGRVFASASSTPLTRPGASSS
jgi:hypothetical protein